jgi:hypothetical protein
MGAIVAMPKADEPRLERAVSECVDAMCRAIRSSITASLARINDAEKNAIARLNSYVPTEPLMDSRQAAAYLKLPLRTLQLKSCPSNPLIPHCFIDGAKRFRKSSLDAWLDSVEVKAPEVRL